MTFPVDHVRALFPSLTVKDNGRARTYLDNPAGTQAPLTVVEAISGYLLNNSSNTGGFFTTSVETDALWSRAHESMAMFLGARSWREIIIGQSMTSLTFHLSRSICRDFKPGDEIIISRKEHEGNVGPWLQIASDMDLTVKWVDFNRDSWQTEPEDLAALITEKTRLVTLNFASNMTGSVNDIAALTKVAKNAGAMVFVDAVQLAPHHLVDVQALGCDFLACSSYKFFGPHLGIVWGREELLKSLHAYKGRCVSDETPDRFEAGTPQYELLAGLEATVAYFEALGSQCGGSGSRRDLVAHAYEASRAYEEPLTNSLISGLLDIPGTTVIGITNSNRMADRVPTVSIRNAKVAPDAMALALSKAGIHVWHGHNYAYEPAIALGMPLDEGVLRIGLAHYNTQAEVDLILQELAKILD